MNNDKIKSATEFLELCKRISEQTVVDKSVIYNLLENYKIKDSNLEKRLTIHPLHYFQEWNNSLGNKNNLKIYNWKNYWTGFDNNAPKTGFIKIYLSLDDDHLCEGVKQLFSYLEQENISHTSKATSHARADNIIIRIDANDTESLKKIYNFVQNNSYIQSGMNQINPFIPNVGKLGVMTDDGRSYNSQLSQLIATYVNNYAVESNIDFSDFSKFVIQQKENDLVFLETFNQAFFEPNKYNNIIYNQVYTNRINIDIRNPVELLEFGILLSFEKHGKEQAVGAIKSALSGNYDSFSRIGYDRNGREVKVRESLCNIVTPQLLEGYILQNNLFSNETNLDNIINNYVDSVIYKHKGKILEDALYATAIKQFDDKMFVQNRIKQYAEKGNGEIFSRYNHSIRQNYNFRESVLLNIAPSKVNSVVESILYNNGINYTNKSQNDKIDDCSNVIIDRIAIKCK